MHWQRRRLRWLDAGLHTAGICPLLAGALIYYVVVNQLFAAADRVNHRQIGELESMIDQRTSLQERFRGVTAELQEIESRAAQMRQMIPLDPNEAEFLREVSELSLAEDLRIRDYIRGQVVPSDDVSRLEIRLLINGDYQSVCRFLDRLEQMHRISRIRSLTIAHPPQGEGYAIDLGVVLYFTAG